MAKSKTGTEADTMATATQPVVTRVTSTEIKRLEFPASSIREVKVTVDGVERDAIEAVINSNDIDRYDTVVEPKGADLKNFQNNPILLWAHGNDFAIGSWPVGTVAELDVTDDELIARIVFDTEGELGAELDRLYRAKILRGFSIGFIPKAHVQEQPEKDGPYIIRYIEWELIELSAVAVPANPHALAKSLAEGELEFRTPELGQVVHLSLVRGNVSPPTAEERELLSEGGGRNYQPSPAPTPKTEAAVPVQPAQAPITRDALDDTPPVLNAVSTEEDAMLNNALAQLDRMASQVATRGGSPVAPGVPGVPGSATPKSDVAATLESARAALSGGGAPDGIPDGDLASRFRELHDKHREGAAASVGKPADADLEELLPEARGEVAAMQFILEHLESVDADAIKVKAIVKEDKVATPIPTENTDQNLATEIAELRKLVLLQAEQIEVVQDRQNDLTDDRGNNETHERGTAPRKYLTKAGREALTASADGLDETAGTLRALADTMAEQSGTIREAIEIVTQGVESEDDAGDGGDQDGRDGSPTKTERLVDAAPEFIREMVAAKVSEILDD